LEKSDFYFIAPLGLAGAMPQALLMSLAWGDAPGLLMSPLWGLLGAMPLGYIKRYHQILIRYEFLTNHVSLRK